MGSDSVASGVASFEPLRHSLNQPETKAVLSLGGGGVRMFAHAAVFEFLEKMGVADRITEVWGASGGAIMGSLFAMGMGAEEMKSIAGVAFKGGIVRYLPGYLSLAKRMLTDLFGLSKQSASLQVFRDYQKQLQDFLIKVMEGRSFQKKFFCTAFNLETEENEVLCGEPVGDFYGSDKVYHAAILDAVMASSAVPVLFEPITIRVEDEEKRYIDGALVEDVPTQSVYKKWLRDKECGLEKSRHLLLISVNLQPSSFVSINLLQNSRVRRLPGFEHLVMSLNCAEYLRKATTKANMKMLQQDPNVELWNLNITVPSGGMLNLDLIPSVVEAAETCVPLEFQRIGADMIF